MVPVVQVLGGAALLAGAGYLVYKAYQAHTHALEREAAKEEGLLDGGAPVQ